jgi:mannose-6-phosphate isomerase-like protein (cupin superfamily)
MNYTTLETAEKVPFNLDGRKMFVDPRAEIIHLNLKTGEVLEKHTNPFDVAIYIIEGEGVVETKDEKLNVTPNFCIAVKAGVQRGLSNTGKSNLRVLVFKIF